MIIGSGLEGGRGPVIPLYQSSDLKHWRYLHPLYQGEGSRFDFLGDLAFCECPSFFPLGGKYVLVVSDKTTYFVGRYEHQRFIPERRGRLDYGKGPTAKDDGIFVPQFVLDGKGRRIMWGWVGGWEKMRRERQANIEAGWAGSQSLPRVLSLNSDGLLDFEPADEIASLRANHRSFDGISLPADDSVLLEGFEGLQLELHAVIDAGTANAVGIELLDGRGKARLFYDVQTGSLCFNQTSVPMELNRVEPLDLRVFVDSTIVEVYANKRIVLTENLQPLSPKGYRIRLFAEGGKGRVLKADGWNMGTIW
jgi:beta-fructofuranosidase